MKSGPLVVIGDTLLDVDLEGTAERLAPDAPVPVVDCHRERHRAGGAGLAALLAARMADGDVVLITALGDDRNGARLRDLLGRHVDVVAMPLRGGTSCKIRVSASGRLIARLDAGDGRASPSPLGAPAERALRSAGSILVADYGRGVTAHQEVRAALVRLPRRVPLVWDPHPKGEPPVPTTRLATPNEREARGFAEAFAARAAGGSAAARDAATLSRAWGTAVAVTIGARGALLSVGDDVPFMAPAPALAAASPGSPDACGAGDCFAAAAVQAIRAGGLLTEAVTEAVRLASEFVARGGASGGPGLTIPPEPGAPAERPRAAGSAWDVVAGVRRSGGRIVATGGCFDLLHTGHVRLLQQARRLGDCLVVCLNSDCSVRELKGPGRPLVEAPDRARVLAALECVDAVVVFDEPTPAAVLERLRPDVWVKGGDYCGGDLAEAPVVRRYGGEVVLLPYTGRHSTSQIVAAARTLAEPVAGGEPPSLLPPGLLGLFLLRVWLPGRRGPPEPGEQRRRGRAHPLPGAPGRAFAAGLAQPGMRLPDDHFQGGPHFALQQVAAASRPVRQTGKRPQRNRRHGHGMRLPAGSVPRCPVPQHRDRVLAQVALTGVFLYGPAQGREPDLLVDGQVPQAALGDIVGRRREYDPR